MATVRTGLLALGVAGPLGFLATGIYGGWSTPGYHAVSVAGSALSQQGAPECDVVNALFLVAALCQVGFGVALTMGHEPGHRRAGWLIVVYAILGSAIAAFFPMDPVGSAVTVPGVLHLVFVGPSALALIAAMILARHFPGRPGFATFTEVCLGGMAAGGVLSALAGALGWPVLGLAERVTQYSYVLWLMVLALLSLRTRASTRPLAPGARLRS